MNPGPPTFRSTLEDLNQPALTIAPAIAPAQSARKALPAAVRRLLPVHAFTTIENIEAAVCEMYSVTSADLHSRSRANPIAGARQMAMYLALELTALSSASLARHFERDHTTILYAHSTIQELASVYPEVRDAIADLRTDIEERGVRP
jgi:chromosomal replication initiation ATPase DnaA